ncbi:MAG TPA: phosphate ABC transporter ATP-binding protein [Syntrophomonadaceae bacterium]|nr:phosphate ABC transporter ATP-binding protein [Syntrophomonadaceae bacterium]
MNVFELESVSKNYGARTVLNVASLQFGKDKIYAILGPNGAGKTTMLRILNLLDLPDKGHIRFMDKDTNIPEHDRLELARRMCMVFQRPVMFRASVFQNVAYGLKLRRMGESEIKARVNETLSFVGLQNFSRQMANKLSGGESQRVALARALVLRPEVLLLDEPTANLAPYSVQMIEDIILKCKHDYQMTVIVVTHNLFQAQRIADECILLVDGEIVEKSGMTEFFSNPADERTRRFIDGTMVY